MSLMIMFGVWLLALGLALYCLPGIIAEYRKVGSLESLGIWLLTFFTGYTVMGWFIALYFALTWPSRRAEIPVLTDVALPDRSAPSTHPGRRLLPASI
jgi:hypothetical protein